MIFRGLKKASYSSTKDLKRQWNWTSEQLVQIFEAEWRTAKD